MIDSNIITDYNKTRKCNNKNIVCYAPFSSLYFNNIGDAVVCCHNQTDVVGSYPKNSVHEMWHGVKLKEMQQAVSKSKLDGGCHKCKEKLLGRDFEGIMAKAFDNFEHEKPSFINKLFRKESYYPKVITFVLSNKCNLECVMCWGHYSSSIRKNRENLPAFHTPYDDEFIDQLEEFFPHLEEIRLLGGEPFLIELYFKIMDRVYAVNPNVRLNITTNGTILNNRVKKILENYKPYLNLSIDSLQKENYEAIRINANFERVKKNIDYFIEERDKGNITLGFSICPNRINRYELPEIIQFLNKNNIEVFFNTVYFPATSSLRSLNKGQVESLIDFYKSAQLPANSNVELFNKNQLIGLTNQLKVWIKDSDKYLTIQSEEKLNAQLQKITDKKISKDELDFGLRNKLASFLAWQHYRIYNDLINREEANMSEYTAKLCSLMDEYFLDFNTFLQAYLDASNKLIQYSDLDSKIKDTKQAQLKELFDFLIEEPFSFRIMKTFIIRNDVFYLLNFYSNELFENIKNFTLIEK